MATVEVVPRFEKQNVKPNGYALVEHATRSTSDYILIGIVIILIAIIIAMLVYIFAYKNKPCKREPERICNTEPPPSNHINDAALKMIHEPFKPRACQIKNVHQSKVAQHVSNIQQQTQDAQFEDAQTQDAQSEDAQFEDTMTMNTSTQDVQTQDVQTQDVQTQDAMNTSTQDVQTQGVRIELIETQVPSISAHTLKPRTSRRKT